MTNPDLQSPTHYHLTIQCLFPGFTRVGLFPRLTRSKLKKTGEEEATTFGITYKGLTGLRSSTVRFNFYNGVQEYKPQFLTCLIANHYQQVNDSRQTIIKVRYIK